VINEIRKKHNVCLWVKDFNWYSNSICFNSCTLGNCSQPPYLLGFVSSGILVLLSSLIKIRQLRYYVHFRVDNLIVIVSIKLNKENLNRIYSKNKKTEQCHLSRFFIFLRFFIWPIESPYFNKLASIYCLKKSLIILFRWKITSKQNSNHKKKHGEYDVFNL